jgi:Glycosyl hydrolase family 79 C-terminal beta domain
VFELERAGVEAVHLHARQHAINDPFTFDGPRFVARPLLYGLILFARTLGPDAQLVQSQLRAPGTDHLKVWAVKVGTGTLHVLYINKGPRDIHVSSQLPGSTTATVQRLLAPSPSAESGVTLGGQSLDQDAQWTGTPVREPVRRVDGEYPVTLPAYSAALLSVPITRGPLRQRR